ncbi:hypothetical protein H6P81_019944 [Aristolochia fimbriata]|uniref:Uncharacterized protein n=1 Tax=Aristolochia fimbriata TaxID=158543 RepID=A0AAV7DUY7_ARIFI|nr:hypothetical protein H6P81_019944 [Aristolochia fimbriata]
MEAAKKRWSLEGKTALVTGGTKGIGRAIVEELAQFGASVYTCARNETELGVRLREWKEAGLNVHGSVCDIFSQSSRSKLMDDVSSVFNGKLNILISNAATLLIKPTLDCTAEDFSSQISTNFESTFHLSQLAHPLLKASEQGCLIFISSVTGILSFTKAGLYSAFKGALNQLTKNLAVEWADDLIRTNSIAPSLTRTPMGAKVIQEGELSYQFLARTPLRRMGETRDVSSLVAFLCMEAASYINGQVIAVDGGFSIYGL